MKPFKIAYHRSGKDNYAKVWVDGTWYMTKDLKVNVPTQSMLREGGKDSAPHPAFCMTGEANDITMLPDKIVIT